MDFLYLIFYGCPRLQFLDVETNPGPWRPVPAVCRILCSYTLQEYSEYYYKQEYSADCRILCRILPAWPGALVTWPWLRLSMIYCCALRLWSQICATCKRCYTWSPCLVASVALSCCVGAKCLGPVGWLHTLEMVTEPFASQNLSVVVAKCCLLGFVV